MISVELTHLSESAFLPAGSSLLDLEPKIKFGCKAAACGRCAIKILNGLENLSPETIKESRCKGILQMKDPSIRLACQVKVNGPISLCLRNGEIKK